MFEFNVNVKIRALSAAHGHYSLDMVEAKVQRRYGKSRH